MDQVRVLTNVPVGDIQNYLDNCKQDFETSQLYNSTRNEKFIDEDLRKSVFRTITDEILFEKIDTFLSKINEDDDCYEFTLKRNDVTHIKYDTGGFFRRHRDFLSTTSNLVEEFTLLLCVTPSSAAKESVIGGNTTIHTFGGAKIFDTTTAGSGILFRKDLEHEGMELERGEKHIITANIWAVRKEHSSQVLLVTFPETAKSKEAHSTSNAMRVASSQSMSYALPVDILTGTMLSAHVEWANRAAEQDGKDIPTVVTYECRDFDFETFAVVEKVLNRSYVEEEDIYNAKECLDYFGPFKNENILVNLSAEAKPDNGSASVGHTKKKARTNESEAFDSDLIICETEARMRAVINVARALGEDHFVPFRILFVEGDLELNCEGELSDVVVPMTAATCLVGDYFNVFHLRNICRRESPVPKSFAEIHRNSNLFRLPTSIMNKIESKAKPGREINLLDRNHFTEWINAGGDDGDLLRNFNKNGYGLSLKVGLRTSTDTKSSVLASCLCEPYGMLNKDTKTVYLPGLYGKKRKDDSTSLFHRNQKGKITFTEKEAERASNFIASSALEERVKRALQTTRFVLPQKASFVEAHFCNEHVYGILNIIWVNGILRMKTTDDS